MTVSRPDGSTSSVNFHFMKLWYHPHCGGNQQHCFQAGLLTCRKTLLAGLTEILACWSRRRWLIGSPAISGCVPVSCELCGALCTTAKQTAIVWFNSQNVAQHSFRDIISENCNSTACPYFLSLAQPKKVQFNTHEARNATDQFLYRVFKLYRGFYRT